MYKKAISIFTLMAFMMYSFAVSGCTKMVKMSADEIRPEPPLTVTQLKLKSGNHVRWGSAGASYVCQAGLFDGFTGGVRQHVRLELVDSVYFVSDQSTNEQALDAAAFHKDCVNRHRDLVRGDIKTLIYDDGIIQFRDNTARIDAANRAVTGVTSQGDTISVPLLQVHSLRVQRTSTKKTLLFLGGLCAWVAISYILIMESDPFLRTF